MVYRHWALGISLMVLGHFAQAGPVLAVEDSWPPYANELGEGISTNIIRAAYAEVGITPQIRVMPYARVLKTVLNSGVHGGYNVTRQASTEGQYHFGAEPLLQADASFYFVKGQRDHTQTIDELSDGVRVGVIRGYEYGNRFDLEKHRFELIEVSRQSQLIRMLLAGRIDAAVMFDAVATYTLTRMGLSSDSISQGFHNHTSDIYVAFDFRQKQSLEYADRLDEGLKRLKRKGLYEPLLKSYEQ